MKRITLLLIILISQLSFGQANKIYREALKTENLDKKIKLLTEVINLEPKKLDAYFHRAIAKNNLGDYHGAIVDYSKIIVIEPDADTYYNRGNSRYSIKDFQGAKEDYEKAYKLDSYFIDALYSLGCVKYDLKEYKAALADFNKVIKAEPYFDKAYTLRAHTYVALKQHKSAIKNYSITIFINPTADSYYNRGACYMDLKNFKKAKSDFSTAIRLNQNNGFAYFYRGASNLFLNKYKNTISDFSSAIRYDQLDFDAILGLSMVYLKIDDLANAKLFFNKAKSILQGNSQNNDDINVFSNTYWYQQHNSFFNTMFNELNKL